MRQWLLSMIGGLSMQAWSAPEEYGQDPQDMPVYTSDLQVAEYSSEETESPSEPEQEQYEAPAESSHEDPSSYSTYTPDEESSE
jgi:hypothetical protein